MIDYTDGKDLKRLFRQALKEKGVTMTQAAQACGLSSQSLNNRFNRKDISLTEINRIAKACGLSVLVDIVSARHAQEGSNNQNL